MRPRLPFLSAAALAACVSICACDQRPADPALPTVDVNLTSIRAFRGELRTRSLWASSAADIYAGRSAVEVDYDLVFNGPPLIRHFDGSQWRDVNLPIEQEYGHTSIWGSEADNVYVAVRSLYHFNGNSWERELDDARVVTGTGPSNVFAASYSHIFHFNGAEWDTLLAGQELFDYSLFAGLDGSLWTVASDSILVWDNVAWRAISPSPPYYRNVIAPFSATEALAIDPPDYFDFDGDTEVLRWKDGEWTEEAVIPAMLNAIWAESSSSVYAVGERGETWHFDGAEWIQLPRQTYFGLYAIAGLPSGGFIAAGNMGKVVSVDDSGARTLREGLWGRAYDSQIWFETASRYMTIGDGVMFRQDGASWSEIVPPFSPGIGTMGGRTIADLFVSAGKSMYHFDGTTWTLSDSLVGHQNAFWVSDGGTILSAGRESVYSYDGTWTQLLEGEFVMNAVAGDERGHILCAGRGIGTYIVKYFDGSAWKDFAAPTQNDLYDVWIGPSGDMFLGGGSGLYKWNGSKFQRLTPPGRFDVQRIIGRDHHVLGFGYENLVVYDGGIVNLEAPPMRLPIVQGRDRNIYGMTDYRLAQWKR